MNLCVKISNQFPFQRIEGWALIQGEGAYLKGGRLFEGRALIRYCD